MKRFLAGLIISLFIVTQGYCVDQWAKSTPSGGSQAADIDSYIGINNEALDRLITNYRQGCKITYASVSTLTVGAGELTLSNSDGSIRRLRKNTTATTVSWSDIDAGAEASSTTYYVYGVADTDAATFTLTISTNSAAPSGKTYYKRLGTFYNDASGNITNITNNANTSSAGKSYDSGWFAVSLSSNYAKTHNLGTTNALCLIWFSTTSDGSSSVYSLDLDPSYSTVGAMIKGFTTTTITVYTNSGHLFYDFNSSSWIDSGYMRIIMLNLE